MTRLFRALQTSHPAGKKVKEHTHHFGQLTIILQGTMTIKTREGWWLVPPGLSVWIPSGISHMSSYSEDSKIILIELDSHDLDTTGKQCRPIVVSDLLKELACEAVRIFSTTEQITGDDQLTLELISKMMVLHIRRSNARPSLFIPGGTDKRLRKATELMHANISEELTLAFVASKSNTSERTLSRLFTIETGMSFRRWRQHLKLVVAVDLLSHGETITNVAFELGYASASSFTSLFTRALGIPPRKYMQRAQKTSSGH